VEAIVYRILLLNLIVAIAPRTALASYYTPFIHIPTLAENARQEVAYSKSKPGLVEQVGNGYLFLRFDFASHTEGFESSSF